ncbi:MAG: sulfite oxidase [Alphaproteobacteria bacterium]|nr:sulfite oxidase [Alphaproteobacteria bacterium]
MSEPKNPITNAAALYASDPERADAVLFGRRGAPGPDGSRRGFLQGAGLAAMGAALGATIPFHRNMPAGVMPAGLGIAPAAAQTAAAAPAAAAGPQMLQISGKAPLINRGERPLNLESAETQLDDDVTPADKLFVRNNGNVPENLPQDPRGWKIRIDGEVNTPLELTLGELESRFPVFTARMVLECGGNGRSFFTPQARGNQWANGAAGCPEWTGVRLKDVLQAAGLKPSAVYTAHYGADPHLSGDPNRVTISRGVRIAKAMDENTMIALRMNGQPLPVLHGYPARLIVPGWAGSASQKWLNRIWIRDKPHDGPGMTGTSYRVPRTPMVPGARFDANTFVTVEDMPVRSILTNVANGTRLPAGARRVDLRGHAWAGERTVRAVHVSIDYGATWQAMEVAAPANKYAWQRWRGQVTLPSAGYFEIWYRATDSDGTQQPMVAGPWNPAGYGGNPISRVAVLAES